MGGHVRLSVTEKFSIVKKNSEILIISVFRGSRVYLPYCQRVRPSGLPEGLTRRQIIELREDIVKLPFLTCRNSYKKRPCLLHTFSTRDKVFPKGD